MRHAADVAYIRSAVGVIQIAFRFAPVISYIERGRGSSVVDIARNQERVIIQAVKPLGNETRPFSRGGEFSFRVAKKGRK